MTSTTQRMMAVISCTVLSLASAARVDAQQLTDVKGSRDPAAIKRYEGSVIIGYKFAKFDEFTFLVGPLTRSTASSGPILVPSKVQRVEGQYTRLVYTGPEGRSPLEVVRNYEQELTKAGFTSVYQCARAECGGSETDLTDGTLYTMKNRLSNYPPAGSGRAPGQVTAYAFSSASDGRLLVAKRTGGGGDAWISVYVATGGFSMHKETVGRPIILVDLVESAGMETKMVTVDASAMAKGIASDGHVALYGILFDFNKADVKPESDPTLTEMAALLKSTPTLRLLVVGHTDNVGGYPFNLDLSQRRATAVVAALVTRFGIAKDRLTPVGVSFASPVAPNTREEGRARNRRVELVEQAPGK
jgi:OmpA-OmpF porin, OOP family